MFYSHEILTDHKHGVATIWLVATLGPKSSLKKVTRKAIMDVNVPNACHTIVDPSAPMALRLQGNLLFGVSRVFSQQCAYVLNDLEGLKDKMRGIAMLLKEIETDPNVVTTRPEQLNLQADPAFDIDLDMGFDLSSFEASFSSNQSSSLLSLHSFASSRTSMLDDELFLEEQAPLDDPSSHGADEAFGFDAADAVQGVSARQGNTLAPSATSWRDEEAMAANPSIVILDDGEVVILDDQDTPDQGDIETSGMTRDAVVGDQNDFQMNLNPDDTIDTEYHAPDDLNREQLMSENTDSRQVVPNQAPQTPVVQPSVNPQLLHQSIEDQSSRYGGQETETVTGAAHQRTAKTKTVPIDEPTELPNRTLADWNDNYLQYMEEAYLENASKISLAQAKRNAIFWVLDQGIASVGTDYRDDKSEHPFAAFSGQDLVNALTGPQEQQENRKRTRSAYGTEEENEDSDTRRVRSRSHKEANSGHERGTSQVNADDELGIDMHENDFEPEVGREEQAPMSDHPDSMPWNQYASSRQGSRFGSARPATSAAGASSSVRGLGAFDFMHSSHRHKRVSRLISESPLEQRRCLLRQSSLAGSAGNRAQDIEGLNSTGNGFDLDVGIDDDELDRQLAGDPNAATDFELYGPAAAVSTQTATSNKWLAEVLENEAYNFLSFLRSTIESKQMDTNDNIYQAEVMVTFGKLLPPADNSEVVAAQGMLHVLSLATQGLIGIYQGEDFGDIEMRIMRDAAGNGDAIDAQA